MVPLEQTEATRLIEDSNGSTSRRIVPIINKSIALLLAMKLVGNVLEYQLAYFNIDAYMQYHQNSSNCQRVPCSQKSNAYSNSLVLGAAFVLSTLSGLISDRFLGCVRVLVAGCIIQLWASVLFPMLIRTSLLCQSRAWYYAIAASMTLSLGLVDPLLLYAIMQHTNGPRSRRFILFSYFVAAAGTECLGCLPAILRYVTQESGVADNFDFIGIVFSALLVACVFFLAKDENVCDRLRTENFEFPRLKRLRRYYIAVAGFIPFTTVIILCRNVFYLTEIKYYAKYTDENVNYAITIGSYQLATVVFSLLGAAAAAARKFPRCLTIRIRIQLGLGLLLACKIILFVASFFHCELSNLGESHPIAIQGAYFVAGFIDGLANSLTDVAMYELVDCIAESCARAMYLGIFYTTWGLGLMLVGIVVKVLKFLPSEGHDMIPGPDGLPHFYIRYAIVIGLLLMCMGYYFKVALPFAEPLCSSDESDQEFD